MTELSDKNFKSDLWEYLSGTDKKIVMYGMGAGAEKIIAVCNSKKIEVHDFFASDGFVRGHSFKGKKVLSFTEAKEKYGAQNMIVLLSFATCLEGVIENIRKIAAECELYVPDVPVSGGEIFDSDFYSRHRAEIDFVRGLLSDDASKALYDDIISFKLSGKTNFLFGNSWAKKDIYSLISSRGKIKIAADFGAYNGDTARECFEYFPGIEKIIAVEPDPKNFIKLSAFADEQNTRNPSKKIIPLLSAVWSTDGIIRVQSGGNRNSNIYGSLGFAPDRQEGTRLPKKAEVEIISRSADSIFAEYGFVPDYIKYDVEGSEREALLGTRQTIKSRAPALLVSLYHRSEDIFDLPLLIHNMRRDYEFYLVKPEYIPAWDIGLVCLKK